MHSDEHILNFDLTGGRSGMIHTFFTAIPPADTAATDRLRFTAATRKIYAQKMEIMVAILRASRSVLKHTKPIPGIGSVSFNCGDWVVTLAITTSTTVDITERDLKAIVSHALGEIHQVNECFTEPITDEMFLANALADVPMSSGIVQVRDGEPIRILPDFRFGVPNHAFRSGGHRFLDATLGRYDPDADWRPPRGF